MPKPPHVSQKDWDEANERAKRAGIAFYNRGKEIENWRVRRAKRKAFWAGAFVGACMSAILFCWW